MNDRQRRAMFAQMHARNKKRDRKNRAIGAGAAFGSVYVGSRINKTLKRNAREAIRNKQHADAILEDIARENERAERWAAGGFRPEDFKTYERAASFQRQNRPRTTQKIYRYLRRNLSDETREKIYEFVRKLPPETNEKLSRYLFEHSELAPRGSQESRVRIKDIGKTYWNEYRKNREVRRTAHHAVGDAAILMRKRVGAGIRKGVRKIPVFFT